MLLTDNQNMAYLCQDRIWSFSSCDILIPFKTNTQLQPWEESILQDPTQIFVGDLI